MAKSLTRCSSLHCTAGSTSAAPTAYFLERAEHGVWAIAEDLELPGDGQPGPGQLLLDVLQEQVASGEDLTAALLVAHGRVQREFGEGHEQGSRVIALRLNLATSSFEMAWVGAMQAYLVRSGEVVQITSVSNRQGETQTNAFQMKAKRVAGLGGSERIRPVIDRKLGHAQAGDFLVLSSQALEGDALVSALRNQLKGIWSLDYKLRTLKGALTDALADHTMMPVLLWRAR